MDKFEKLALEAIEESKSRSYTPQDPFVSFGFDANPFLEVTIEDLQEEECIESRFKVIIQYVNVVFNSFNCTDIIDGWAYFTSFSLVNCV